MTYSIIKILGKFNTILWPILFRGTSR